MGISVARNGPNDELFDIWEVSEELDDTGIKFINIWNALLVQAGVDYESADVCAQIWRLRLKVEQ